MASRTYKKFSCKECNYSVTEEKDFIEHFYSNHGTRRWCNICQLRPHARITHAFRMHATEEYGCVHCNETFQNSQNVFEHVVLRHDLPANNTFQETMSAFRRRVQTFTTTYPPGTCLSLENFFLEKKEDIISLVRRQLVNKLLIRYSLIVYGTYVKYDHNGVIDETVSIPLRSISQQLLLGDIATVPTSLSLMEKDIMTRHDQFIDAGSGWVLHYVSKANVEVCQISMRGGCGKLAVYKLHRSLRRCVADVPSKRNDCFLNSVSLGLTSSAIQKVPPKERLLHVREYAKTFLNTKSIDRDTLVTLKDIRKFEGKNASHNFGINVYAIEVGKHVYPVYKSRFDCAPQVVNLLMIPYKGEHHFVLITRLTKLINAFSLNEEVKRRNFICDHCMQSFSRLEGLISHEMNCTKFPKMKTVIPEEGRQLHFSNFIRTVPHGIVGFADFESSLKPLDREKNAETYNCDNCRREGPVSECPHKSRDVHEQVASTYSIVLVSSSGEILFERTHYSDYQLLKHFFDALEELKINIYPLYENSKH